MMNDTSKSDFIFAGNIPYLAVLILCTLSVYCGIEYQKYVHSHQKVNPKIAIAEKTAIILQAAISRQDLSDESLTRDIKLPILAVIKRYTDKGYLVIDSSPNDDGTFTVTGIPDGAINITDEMKKAIKPESR